MTDRELLEAAAKAAGIDVLPTSRWPIGQEQFGLWIQVGEHRTAVGWWNPLTNDGDALRLAVKLEMHIRIYADECNAIVWGHGADATEPSTHDQAATVRRAIVRAAASMAE